MASALLVVLVVLMVISAGRALHMSLHPNLRVRMSEGRLGVAWWNQEKLQIGLPPGLWTKPVDWSISLVPRLNLNGPDFRDIMLPLWPLVVACGVLAWRASRRPAKQQPAGST